MDTVPAGRVPIKADDEIGRLDCGHYHHIECIKQWLLQKNAILCIKRSRPNIINVRICT